MNNLKPCPICDLEHQVHNKQGTVRGKTMSVFFFFFHTVQKKTLLTVFKSVKMNWVLYLAF